MTQEKKPASPQLEFSVNWMGAHTQIWRNTLCQFVGKHCHALELGSYEGRSAIWFVENILTHELSTITCVDGFFGSEYPPKYYKNIVVSGAYKKIVTLRGDTHEVVRGIRKSFDFIYIDADHHAWPVVSDIASCWPLLKIGGIMILDDYAHQGYDCKIGIDFFLETCKDNYELLNKGWQVIVKKIK